MCLDVSFTVRSMKHSCLIASTCYVLRVTGLVWLFSTLVTRLFITGSGDGGARFEKFAAKQDRVLHNGSGGRREASNRPGRGFQTSVSYSLLQ